MAARAREPGQPWPRGVAERCFHGSSLYSTVYAVPIVLSDLSGRVASGILSVALARGPGASADAGPPIRTLPASAKPQSALHLVVAKSRDVLPQHFSDFFNHGWTQMDTDEGSGGVTSDQ